MPSIFLSYSREDLSLIQELTAQLNIHTEISIWRDQEKIYGGQKWPKILGEAIADQDVFLLAWSKNAAISHFVEFEWTTALALKKVIVPCLLDNTPLPSSLAALHAIDSDEIANIVTAVNGVKLNENATRKAEVVSKLEQIQATNSETVLQHVKALFDQPNWAVHGNVIQGENVTIHIGERAIQPTQGLLEKWQIWVGIMVGVLTILSLITELPGKIMSTIKPQVEVSTLQSLAGAIRNEANDPLPGVQVSLPQFNLTNTTDRYGQFRFDVKASKQDSVALLAQKPGYQNYEADVTLGNTSLGFTMRIKKP
ncbi:hypothetical protein W03_22710 [Nitrosomonas sp. PY1]|uniref:toll/interleukin-1 receptor domain-containing protein n=1 Tax=Nitrosomonas sp. PY1 TaxID=1803906 RepID=UPI001FC8C5E3|nr:TIR domain-containing protein [Nitrosomonas sp. PY1]GKS70267.1 hypothetical protein W03_22710 [Nitrosomonas sp. PY1]